MTEEQWWSCANPQQMLEFLAPKVSGRQLRLFACACARKVWCRLDHEWARRALEAAEQYLAGDISPEAAAEAHRDLQRGFRLLNRARRTSKMALFAVSWASLPLSPYEPEAERIDPRRRPLVAAQQAAKYADFRWPTRPEERLRGRPEESGATQAHLVALVHDIFGNPFRPVVVSPAWLAWNSGTIPRLARAAYEERDLPSGHLDRTRLAILADALEESGCSDPRILEHLRGSGPCVRGCAVVDALRGRD
jgi:hypothetical protein